MITTTARRRTHQPTKTSRTRGSRGVSRAITMLLAACLLLALTAVPATADPPERFDTPAPGFVFPDFGSGYWFFVDVNRDAVCGGPDPFVGTALFQVLETSDAVVRQSTTAAAKTWHDPSVLGRRVYANVAEAKVEHHHMRCPLRQTSTSSASGAPVSSSSGRCDARGRARRTAAWRR